MKEILIVGLVVFIALIASGVKPALAKSFLQIEEKIAKDNEASEILKAKATQVWVESQGK